MNIESGILLIATASPDPLDTDRHTVSAEGAQTWGINAFNAGVNGASQLGWEPVRKPSYMPNTYDL